MKVNGTRFAIAATTAAMMMAAAGSAHAFNVTIDQFYIQKNGNKYVNDTFSDGIAPPSSNDTFGSGTAPVSYNTLGTWTESGGRAQIDAANALTGLISATSGNPLTLARARVNSNTDTGNTLFGLKSDDTFQVRGLFDLSSNLDIPGGYGIRLTDPTSLALSHDRSQLSVRRTQSGDLRVSFADIDLGAGTITNLDSDLLQAGHDQILLVLSRDTTTSGITASYAYVDGGSIDIGDNSALSGLSFNSLDGTSAIFSGPFATQAEFFATENPVQVSEPGMLALFGVALAGLGVTRRRQRR